CAVGQEKLLIVAQEGRGVRASLIPDQHAPAPGLQNPEEFRSSSDAIKPMGGLRRSDEIDRLRAQRRLLCSARYRLQPAKGFLQPLTQQVVSRFSHLCIRFNREDTVAVLEQKTRERAGARPDIRHCMSRPQAALGSQSLEHFRRIAGSIANIIRYSIRKT